MDKKSVVNSERPCREEPKVPSVRFPELPNSMFAVVDVESLYLERGQEES